MALEPAEIVPGDTPGLSVRLDCPEPLRATAVVVHLYATLTTRTLGRAATVAVQQLVGGPSALPRGVSELRLPLALPAGLPPTRAADASGSGGVRYGADVLVELAGRPDARATFAPRILPAALLPAHVDAPLVLTLRQRGGPIAARAWLDRQVVRPGDRLHVRLACALAGRRAAVAARLGAQVVRGDDTRELTELRSERELGDIVAGAVTELIVHVPADATPSFAAPLARVCWTLDLSLSSAHAEVAVARVPITVVDARTPLVSAPASGRAFR